MSEAGERTSGGPSGTSGGARRARIAWLVLGALVFIATQSVANVESTIDDLAKLGVHESRGTVWTWQLSSVGVWLALMPLLWWLAATLRPPRFGWPVAALLHALATVPVSLVHVLAMVAIRKLAYAAAGQVYDFGDWGVGLLYEYRKDVATYVMFLAFLAFAQWLLARPVGEEPEEKEETEVLLVPDGSITHHVPVNEIDWIGSAGNYVEISWEGGPPLLHRTTLSALAEQLGPGFVRIHRSRLVRRENVLRVETDKSGDFRVRLISGETLRGSRRYRSGL